jgi:hypothetical protein
VGNVTFVSSVIQRQGTRNVIYVILFHRDDVKLDVQRTRLERHVTQIVASLNGSDAVLVYAGNEYLVTTVSAVTDYMCDDGYRKVANECGGYSVFVFQTYFVNVVDLQLHNLSNSKMHIT